MMKCPASKSSSKRPNIGSSDSRKEMEELLISRGSSSFNDGMLSMLFGINLALGSISKGQTVLLDRIEDIARRMEILEKEVKSLKKEESVPQEPMLPEAFPQALRKDIADLENSLMNSPINGSIPDIQCYETLNSSSSPWNDPTWSWNGFMDLQEWEKVDTPMINFQKPT